MERKQESARPRRTQQERRETTRRALLDAAVASLVELGYAGTTTTEVAHRAGVSLGALGHHFPAKADLLTAAMDHVLGQRLEEFDRIVGSAPAGVQPFSQLIDITWELFQSPAFAAWLELWTAARTDPGLRAAVVEVDTRFSAGVAERLARVLPQTGFDLRDRIARSLVFAVCNGLAMRRVIPVPHEAGADEVLGLFKEALQRSFAPDEAS